MSKYRANLQMTETTCQLLLQSETSEQGLEQDQAGKGGQSLIFKTEFWSRMNFAMDAGFATLHANGLSWFYWLDLQLQFYQLRERFFLWQRSNFRFVFQGRPERTSGEVQTHGFKVQSSL